MSEITKANFGKKLSGVVRSARNMRDGVQELIAFGLDVYQREGDTGYLTRLIQSTVETKALPTRTIKDYVKAHANVTYSKAKDGSLVFKKAAKGAEPEVVMPSEPWYEWQGGRHNATSQDLDVVKRLKSLRSAITKARKEGKTIKADGLEEEIRGVMADLGIQGQG